MNSPNNSRASEANTALQAFWADSEDVELAPGEADCGRPKEVTALVYLLAALRHLCDAQDWDFSSIDRAAYETYSEDKANCPIADSSFAEERVS